MWKKLDEPVPVFASISIVALVTIVVIQGIFIYMSKTDADIMRATYECRNVGVPLEKKSPTARETTNEDFVISEEIGTF